MRRVGRRQPDSSRKATPARVALRHAWRPLVGVALAGALCMIAARAPAVAQPVAVVVRTAIAGEVLPFHLAVAGQMVVEGDPMVYVRCDTTAAPVLAAIAPVSGRVTRVLVRPGSHVQIGGVVAAIQPGGPPAVRRPTVSPNGRIARGVCPAPVQAEVKVR
jgi:biotin carboxyl carrier protein